MAKRTLSSLTEPQQTRVIIAPPGISPLDLAKAHFNGSSMVLIDNGPKGLGGRVVTLSNQVKDKLLPHLQLASRPSGARFLIYHQGRAFVLKRQTSISSPSCSSDSL